MYFVPVYQGPREAEKHEVDSSGPQFYRAPRGHVHPIDLIHPHHVTHQTTLVDFHPFSCVRFRTNKPMSRNSTVPEEKVGRRVHGCPTLFLDEGHCPSPSSVNLNLRPFDALAAATGQHQGREEDKHGGAENQVHATNFGEPNAPSIPIYSWTDSPLVLMPPHGGCFPGANPVMYGSPRRIFVRYVYLSYAGMK